MIDSAPSYDATSLRPGELIRTLGQRSSDLPPAVQELARTALRLTGWEVPDNVPDVPQMVLIGYPHTDNLDFLVMLACAAQYGLAVRWFGKASLFRPPFGALLEALGGIKVDRSGANNVVDRMVEAFAQNPRMVLVVSAEGTRQYRDAWKSGFYHIAMGAGVPIGLTYLDYKRHRAGIGAVILPSGDVRHDMAQIRAYYEEVGAVGRVPENAGRVRLPAEDEA